MSQITDDKYVFMDLSNLLEGNLLDNVLFHAIKSLKTVQILHANIKCGPCLKSLLPTVAYQKKKKGNCQAMKSDDYQYMHTL